MTIDISAEKASLDNAIAAFADDVNEQGLVLSPDKIIADGRIHRCPVAGKGRRNLSGRYLLHLDGIPAGGFQNWTDGNGWQNWSFREGPQLSAEEREQLGRKSTAAREAAAAQAERDAKRARDKAGRILIGSEPLTEHAYLTKKRVAAYGLRLAYNDIIVPLRDVNGQLQNLQYITADGDKFFLRDGRVLGFFHPIGDGPDPDVLVIAEGYATGATIHAVTGHIALVAFNAGNLEPVATAAHKRWPHADIIIAADDDHAKDRDKGTNAGITCGMAAALAVNGKVAVPDFAGAPRGEKDTDFNDLANHPDIVGEDAVKRAFDSALKPDDLLVKIILADPLRVFSGWRRKAYAELKGRNQEAFERLRGELKKAGVRITELDGEADAPANDAGNGKDQEKETERQVDKLVSIARSKAQFFHTPKRVPYADISRNGARETHPIRGHDFRMWLGYEYHQQTKASPSKDALANAVGTLEGYAQYEGEQRDVFIRVGGYGGKIYIDLGDVTWRAIEVDADGWRIVNEPPVRFRRSDGAQALPEPTRGESIRDLRPFLNVSSEAAFVIIVAWIVGALRDRGPYLVVAVYGPGGSAKTTMARLLRSLTDPRIPTTERLPRDRETLILNASLAHVQAFDNISVIQLDMSDDLSTLATGSGLTKRALYTDEGQTIFEACRPLLLNGIETFVLRGDLASRTATVTLEEIADDKRRDEETFLAEFEAKRPGILGALLDAVSRGLRQMPTTKVERLPRMADAAKWVVACETGATWAKDKAGRPITFLSALAEDNEETALAVLATSPLARELRRFIEILKAGEWRGTVGALYAKLNDQLDGGPDGDSNKERKALERERKWPKDSIRLSGALRRIIPQLPFWGIGVTFGEHTEQGREVCVRRLPPKARKSSSASSASSAADRKGKRNQVVSHQNGPQSPAAPDRHFNVSASSAHPGGSGPSPGPDDVPDDSLTISDVGNVQGANFTNRLKSEGKKENPDVADDADDRLQKLRGAPRGDTPIEVPGVGRGKAATVLCRKCADPSGLPVNEYTIKGERVVLHPDCVPHWERDPTPHRSLARPNPPAISSGPDDSMDDFQ